MKFDEQQKKEFEEFIGESKPKIELENTKTGKVFTIEINPLPSRYIGRLVWLQAHMPMPKLLTPHEVKAGRKARYEDNETFMSRLSKEDYDIHSELFEIMKLWLQNSLEDASDDQIEMILYRFGGQLQELFFKMHADIETPQQDDDMSDFVKMQREKMGTQNEETKSTETSES